METRFENTSGLVGDTFGLDILLLADPEWFWDLLSANKWI